MDFISQLWAGVPGATDGDKARFVLGIVVSAGTLIALFWNLYRWATKHDLRGTTEAILRTQQSENERAAEERRELRELVLKLSAKVEARLAALPPAYVTAGDLYGNPAIMKDLRAAVDRLAAGGNQQALASLASGENGEALEALAAMRNGAYPAEGHVMRDQAVIAREQGAIAFLNNTQEAMRHYAEAARLDPYDKECAQQLDSLRAQA